MRKELQDIEIAAYAFDYELTTKLIESFELLSRNEKINLKAKLGNIEIDDSYNGIVGGLLHVGILEKSEFNNAKTKIDNKVANSKIEFSKALSEIESRLIAEGK